MDYPRGKQALRHTIEFGESDQAFKLVDEAIGNERPYDGYDEPLCFYRYLNGRPALYVRNGDRKLHRPDNVALYESTWRGPSPEPGEPRLLRPEDVASDESILSQWRDPDQFPELAHLSRVYEGIRIHRDWAFGQRTELRGPHSIDVRPGPLREDFTNLGMYLSRLRQHPKTKASLIEKLSDAYEGLTDFELNFDGNTVQVYFTEGELAVPPCRLSDGSLRYLCLLAMLVDPYPPRLLAIEEPEMGMHPDLIPKLADLLVDASRRCQLIVTTHSDILVDVLSERPESVVVCEKHHGETSMRRLDRSDLAHWLDKYRLGELWTSGELGGVRW